jgi:hypothetical protein
MYAQHHVDLTSSRSRERIMKKVHQQKEKR